MWKSMDTCRDWKSEKERNWVLGEEPVVGCLSLTVSAGPKDMVEWILCVRNKTNRQNALQGVIRVYELNLPLF